ncbi:CLUMA_CG012616, isoform A [Clunio marinus]|uniref:CLUMA_CG012616, isoform A n=1 Tax=Clunio marinus TaxID=568069 RepID=A0A1J1IGK6_9DIPT|nr:CLUMA_CG012616, isoform A [Clunio marinus]
MTTGLAGPILSMGAVHYLPAAKSGTFFARDNVSNFITWCRNCLQIFECLLFETDDLIMRKNEKHVILCLLEVARRGARFGMLAPMLVQMERQIDREIAADNKANGVSFETQTDITHMISIGTENSFDSDSEDEEDDNGPMLMYGPQPQIVTNDLKSLDEMVRDLVEKCTCPSQFPMIRVSEGKYRIGDTKVLIFVRILRSHVMVRVGGGWDTLSHYLDKHDPCRCKAQHRTSVAAKLFTRTNQQNGIELHKAQVVYERSPSASRKFSTGNMAASSTAVGNLQTNENLSLPTCNRSRSRSPTGERKSNITSHTPEPSQTSEKTFLTASQSFQRRSMSPSPRHLTDIRKKQSSLEIPQSTISTHISSVQIPLAQDDPVLSDLAKIESTSNGTTTNNDGANKYENASDNGRRHDRNSPEIITPASDEVTLSEPKPHSTILFEKTVDSIKEIETKFEKSGIVVKDNDISVDIASMTGLRKTGFSEVLYEDNPIFAVRKGPQSRIPKSPMLTRRKSMDNCSTFMTPEEETFGRISTYRSVRKPQKQKERTSLKENTWNGRSSATPSNQTKKRPIMTSDTFKTPSRTASLTRNTPTRSSAQEFDIRTRQRPSTRTSSSVNTSPNKTNNSNTVQSPLAQQLLEAAGKARNDAQILIKIKQILNDYASKNKINGDFDDFTTTWVNNNGLLEDAIDESLVKSQSNRNSSISTSCESNPTATSSGDLPVSATLSPRRSNKGMSKIPAPVRSNTGLY